MVVMHYDRLVEVVEFVCEHYDREIEYINDNCQQFLHDTIHVEAQVAPPIDLDDYLGVATRRNVRARQENIDATGWDEKQVDTLFQQTINLCAAEQKKIQYDYLTQKDTVTLDLAWGALSPYFDKYSGSKSDWRKKFTDWIRREKPIRLRIKGVKSV